MRVIDGPLCAHCSAAELARYERHLQAPYVQLPDPIGDWMAAGHPPFDDTPDMRDWQRAFPHLNWSEP